MAGMVDAAAQLVVIDMEVTSKKCFDCGEIKPSSEFGKVAVSKSLDGLRPYCKSCHNTHNKAWKLANATRVRGNHLKKFWPYLTSEQRINEYMRLLATQNSKCKICKKYETGKHHKGKVRLLAVDHDHKTGKVRGLLCDKCNRAIGMLGENTSTLFSAIQYLEGA